MFVENNNPSFPSPYTAYDDKDFMNIPIFLLTYKFALPIISTPFHTEVKKIKLNNG